MSLKGELIVGTRVVTLAWVLYAGLTGYLEYLNTQLIEAGINIWELMK